MTLSWIYLVPCQVHLLKTARDILIQKERTIYISKIIDLWCVKVVNDFICIRSKI